MSDKAIYSKGRISIPESMRKEFGINEGDIFLVEVKDNKLILKKAKVVEAK